jgi:DNA-binding transcriptional LysR family regulator
MEMRQLKYFVRIVDVGSFSKAAAELFVAQPALSKQIKMLEAELGATLLTRNVRGVVPTESGTVFYRHAHAVLRQLERMSGEIAETKANPAGVVALGIPQSPASVLAASLVNAVNERYPGIQLQIREGVSGMLEELVLNGRLDMSLLFDRPLRPQHLHALPLLAEPLFLVTAATGAKEQDTISLKEASKYSFVLPGPTNTTRQIIENAFNKNSLTLKLLAEVDAISTMKSVIRSGLGATILSSSGLYQDNGASNLNVRRIVAPELKRGISLCASDIAALSRAAQVIFDLIPAVVRGLVADGRWSGAILPDDRADANHI